MTQRPISVINYNGLISLNTQYTLLPLIFWGDQSTGESADINELNGVGLNKKDHSAESL